ncbi:hypothetical protein GCM10027176_47960 [Actinoallomurus bryophytorum]|uniref:Secreted protein n=1 Tax=Actinoallomurus bryophytorum TaxID=1490222 RepID=A0A543CF73_9ACTN|nr:hypothetical protein [Actinoallomurus bryophytorum]TQL95741.1 hypothetical protein FB559_1249 [Actinoallomurus bryophytorum]
MIRFRQTALLIPLALFALSGCGGGGGGAAPSSSANAEDSQVKFAQCMRQHGVQVEDPEPGQPGVRMRVHSTQGKQQMDTAMQACRKYNPMKPMDPNDPRARDQMLKMARCLRAHGVQIADPQPGHGVQIQVKKGDTKTQQAMETCRKLYPPRGASPKPTGGN